MSYFSIITSLVVGLNYILLDIFCISLIANGVEHYFKFCFIKRLFIDVLCVCMPCLHLYNCTLCMPVPKKVKKISDPLKPDLQEALNCHLGFGTEL